MADQLQGEPETEGGSGSAKIVSSMKASKRLQGIIACAECRRLKIRCDKLVPCGSCIRRGCTSLCPNGTIPPGQGGRFVLAATDHLQRKVAKLEARMHSLEDALAIAQTTHNLEPHPLLSLKEEDEHTDAQALKPIPEQIDSVPSANADESGTLHINSSGINRFFGPSGASESLLLEVVSQEQRLKPTAPLHFPKLDNSYLPPEILNFSLSFPFTPQNIPIASTQKSIESFLPPIERATLLCDTFLEHLSWMFCIVSRKHLISDLIPAIYESKGSYGPHDLALLFIALGIGVLVDLNIEPYNLEAQHFYHLARAASVLQPVLTEPSVVTIKLLHLMSVHNGLSGQESNLEQSHNLISLAGQVATRVGFHIDPSSWGFQGREAYDRRVYFWNLLAGVLWNSLTTGRPPAISEFIDCKIPTAEEEAMYQQGEFPLGFGVWGFQTTLNCLIPLVRLTLSAKSPAYESVLELDAKIRYATVPPKTNSDPSDDRTAISMQTFVRSHYSHLMLMFLHRGYFTQAMTEHFSNPLLSPFRKSVMSAYESACFVLEDTRMQFQKKPLLVARVWMIWSFAISAAVIVGTVATSGLRLTLEPSPLEQLELAYEIFRDAAEISNRAARALPVLQTMLQKAIEAQKLHNEPSFEMENKRFQPEPPNRSGINVIPEPALDLLMSDLTGDYSYPYTKFASAPHSQMLPKISTSFPSSDRFVARDPLEHEPSGARNMRSDTPASLFSSYPQRHPYDLSPAWGLNESNPVNIYPDNPGAESKRIYME